MDILVKEIVAVFRCPGCDQSMRPPIPLCENGHNICNLCNDKLACCPVCNGKLSAIKCEALNKVAKKVGTVLVPCKNINFGCNELFFPDHMELHETACRFIPYDCPFSLVASCGWEGILNDLRTHVEVQHPQSVLHVEGKFSTLLKDFDQTIQLGNPTDNWCQLLYTYDEMFFLYSKRRSNFIYSCVLYVGPMGNDSNYKYRLNMKSCKGCGSITFSNLTENYQVGLHCLFSRGACSVVPLEFARECLIPKKNGLPLEVEIFKDDP